MPPRRARAAGTGRAGCRQGQRRSPPRYRARRRPRRSGADPVATAGPGHVASRSPHVVAGLEVDHAEELIDADARDDDRGDDDADDRQDHADPAHHHTSRAQARVVRATLCGGLLRLVTLDYRRDPAEDAEADEAGDAQDERPDTEAVLLGPIAVVPGCRGVGGGGRVALLTVRRGLLTVRRGLLAVGGRLLAIGGRLLPVGVLARGLVRVLRTVGRAHRCSFDDGSMSEPDSALPRAVSYTHLRAHET